MAELSFFIYIPAVLEFSGFHKEKKTGKFIYDGYTSMKNRNTNTIGMFQTLSAFRRGVV